MIGRVYAISGVRIHPAATVAANADLGVDVEIGPHVVIESGVRIADRTRVLASAYIASACEIGSDCEVFPGAVLGTAAQVRGARGSGGRLEIGARTVIREHVTVHRALRAGDRTTVGADCWLLAGSHVAHDCRVGDGTTIANGALLAGHVTVGDAAFLSGNVVVHQHVQIGRLAMIAGQARVTKDVPPFALVIGDSTVCGLNVVGMRRAGMSAAQRRNAARAYAVVYRSQLNVSQAVARLRELPPSDETDAWLAFIDASTRGLCNARHGNTGRYRLDPDE
jgi:UDP-N-acetylglucosamine acyltransferase